MNIPAELNRLMWLSQHTKTAELIAKVKVLHYDYRDSDEKLLWRITSIKTSTEKVGWFFGKEEYITTLTELERIFKEA